jgi:hypothetical protein
MGVALKLELLHIGDPSPFPSLGFFAKGAHQMIKKLDFYVKK